MASSERFLNFYLEPPKFALFYRFFSLRRSSYFRGKLGKFEGSKQNFKIRFDDAIYIPLRFSKQLKS